MAHEDRMFCSAMLSRRDSLMGLAAAIAFMESGLVASPARGRAEREAFSWEWLKALALRIAHAPWRARQPIAAAGVIDYEEMNRISFRFEKALWRGDGDRETRFFPLHRFANLPVSISVVENGRAYPLAFAPDLFDVKADKRGNNFKLAPGFAGFRVMNASGRGDWLAFQGASYFRSSGALDQYGLSARGLAIDTGIDGAEEFPTFTRFWLERGPGEALTVYALIEGPSVAGAYRFVNRKTEAGPVQDVSLLIRLRRDVARLGIAPLTSMFWYGEGNRAAAADWRPEIHDSDGLSLLTGAGERIWRPLANPPRPTINSFGDRAPRGFGLLQRDREFAHYQDDGAFYEKRPNLWVEPKGAWGKGSVRLIEIPILDETHDNIVAFWTPEEPVNAGRELRVAYSLLWSVQPPLATGLMTVEATRVGRGGEAGAERPTDLRRVVVEFGPPPAALPPDAVPQVILECRNGECLPPALGRLEPTGGWQVALDVRPGDGAVELRCLLALEGKPISETWLYRLDNS